MNGHDMVRNSFRQPPWQVWAIGVLTAAFCFSAAIGIAENYPNSYPRKNAKEALHNDRVNIWEVTWPKGEPTPMHVHPLDQFSITLRGGIVRATRPGGPLGAPHDSELGSVTFTPKGTIHMEEGMSDVPQHKIMLEIKPYVTQPVPAVNGIQGAFPREGAVKVFENERLTAWDFTWKPGQIVPRHGNMFDSVTVFLDGGTIRSTTDQGDAKDTVRNHGDVVYTAHEMKAHTEQAVKGSPRAVIVELK